jgi:hypothetical protein
MCFRVLLDLDISVTEKLTMPHLDRLYMVALLPLRSHVVSLTKYIHAHVI